MVALFVVGLLNREEYRTKFIRFFDRKEKQHAQRGTQKSWTDTSLFKTRVCACSTHITVQTCGRQSSPGVHAIFGYFMLSFSFSFRPQMALCKSVGCLPATATALKFKKYREEQTRNFHPKKTDCVLSRFFSLSF